MINPTRPVLGASLLVISLAVSAIYALIGWGGVFVFGLGTNIWDAYFLIYPFLFLLILLSGLFSLRVMAALLLAHFILDWIVRISTDWPHVTLNPVQSYGDIVALSIVVLGVTAYLLFPKEARGLGVFRAISLLTSEE